MRRAAGFTLLELVVAITISSIVIIFVSMFMAAPVDAYAASVRRNALVADAAAAWPRMEMDLRRALPNSVRWRRNGNFVALEMLRVEAEARYMAPPSMSFTAAGTLPSGFPYLSVGNRGTLGENAYALANTITPATAAITIAPGAIAGESSITVSVPPNLTGASPRQRIYVVSGPVTYLCDETQGTLRRYSNYPIVLNQAARDTTAEFTAIGAGPGVLIAQGLSACNFDGSPVGGAQSQTVSVRLTTTRNNESVTLLHESRAEYVP